MAEQTWEYCHLLLLENRTHQHQIHIRYYSVDGEEIAFPLVNPRKDMDFNPFAKAMAQLGARGWELVSMQHGNAHGGQFKMESQSLVLDNKIAYFKRPTQPGRKVNEPPLEI